MRTIWRLFSAALIGGRLGQRGGRPLSEAVSCVYGGSLSVSKGTGGVPGASGERQEGGPEAEDHGQRHGGPGHHRHGPGQDRCRGAGILCEGRQDHRPGSFSYVRGGRGGRPAGAHQLCEAVLFRDSLCAQGTVDADRAG